MNRLEDIHLITREKLRKRFQLNPVDLKYPMPERPVRALGMVNINGEVFSSDEFLRVLIMNISIALVRGVRTVFLGPRIELDLPIFSSETILMGKDRIFFLDVQRRGGYDRHDDTELYDRLNAIKDKYGSLLAHPKTQSGEIQRTFSKASCYVNTKQHQDQEALNLFDEYLEVYLDLLIKTQPLQGDAMQQARSDYDIYTNTVIDHDPAAKIYKLLFGKKGGVARVRELFFAC